MLVACPAGGEALCDPSAGSRSGWKPHLQGSPYAVSFSHWKARVTPSAMTLHGLSCRATPLAGGCAVPPLTCEGPTFTVQQERKRSEMEPVDIVLNQKHLRLLLSWTGCVSPSLFLAPPTPGEALWDSGKTVGFNSFST